MESMGLIMKSIMWGGLTIRFVIGSVIGSVSSCHKVSQKSLCQNSQVGSTPSISLPTGKEIDVSIQIKKMQTNIISGYRLGSNR